MAWADLGSLFSAWLAPLLAMGVQCKQAGGFGYQWQAISTQTA
jgi:hypothetical protein